MCSELASVLLEEREGEKGPLLFPGLQYYSRISILLVAATLKCTLVHEFFSTAETLQNTHKTEEYERRH